MFKLFFVGVIFVSGSVWAGTHGGGVQSVSSDAALSHSPFDKSTKFLRVVGQEQGEIVFEMGSVNLRNELYTKTYKARAEEITAASIPVADAVNKSLLNMDWVMVEGK